MNHEEALINAFFAPTKRERYLEIVANPKKRKKFLLELARFKSLEPRRRFALPKGLHTADEIAAFLSRKGELPTCCVTSEDSELDGREMPLVNALRRIVGCQMGTCLSCVSGILAYFEDEEGRWILERHN